MLSDSNSDCIPKENCYSKVNYWYIQFLEIRDK